MTTEHETAWVESAADQTSGWSPIAGSELERLLHQEFGDNRAAKGLVRGSTISILSKCADPRLPAGEQKTGLICGYVQSGKTLSFTAVGAGAHDNGYRIVIVIAGTTNILAEQSRDRLLRDLGVNEHPLRPWRHFHNPSSRLRDTFRQLLHAWTSDHGRKQTILVTVLKHQTRISNVAHLLSTVDPELLGPVLVIDDEADQAGLNNLVRKQEQSATYSAILRLREGLSHHTYLQYTATPQANIFIPLIDLLSPDFCEVLEPGEGYVGGHLIFKGREQDLVRLIPDNELPSQHDEVQPPPSLVEATRVFLVGVACGLIDVNRTGVLSPRNRSMLVHPSRLVNAQRVYRSWIQQALRQWADVLSDESEPDREDVIESFRPAYEDLLSTVGQRQMPTFEQIMQRLADAIRETEVREVNAASVDQMTWNDEWRQHYAWILVGGQKLDRGFTVEGLTVTYMPRGRGAGYADTIQQRGRFFGYKAGYLDYCRIFLEADVRHAFRVYVDSEESMRDFLRSVSRDGRLRDPNLKRQFQMDRSLQPTRRSILLDPPRHKDLRTGWCVQSRPHAVMEIARQNAEVIAQFKARHRVGSETRSGEAPWLPDPSRAQLTHLHKVSDSVPLAVLHEEVLTRLLMSHADDDLQWQVAIAMVEQNLAEHENSPARIIWMRPEAETHRGTTEASAISQLFQGAYPNHRPYAYLGDKAVHEDLVTLQVHSLQVYEGAVDQRKSPAWHDVTALALWLDDDLRSTMLVQEQSSST